MNFSIRIPKGIGSTLFFAAIIYLLLVSGGFFPYAPEDWMKGAVKGGVLVGFGVIFFSTRLKRSIVRPLSCFLLLGFLIGVFGLFRARDLGMALEKVEGAVFCSAAVAFIWYQGHQKFGWRKINFAFVFFSFIVLLATVAYKLQFGFFDRATRFFLSGPIVYGWIMGLSALVSLFLWEREKNMTYVFFFLSFSFAMVWTESKGAIVAFAVAFAFYSVYVFRNNPRIAIFGLLCLLASWFFLFDDFLRFVEDSRFAAIGRFLGGELGAVDDGSIGVRTILINKALEDVWINPVSGIGLTGFVFDEYVYPHNQHLEVFVELGIFVGVLHLFFLMFSFYRASPNLKAIIIFFIVAGSFSGDMSYLRFLYAFCLLAFVGATVTARWNLATSKDEASRMA